MNEVATLISAHELLSLQKRGGVLVVDCRFELGDADAAGRAYAAAHVPGAVYAHLDRDLSDLSKAGLGRHPLPDDAAFSAVLARWAWTSDLDVVAYDSAGGALAAARLWWLLRLAGHARVAVLDGGFPAWQAGGLPMESGEMVRDSTFVQVAFDRDAVVGYDELQRRRERGGMVLLDARAAPRFRGDVEPLDRVAGHVPGAVNRPFQHNLAADGRFRSPAQLHEDFTRLLGATEPREVVHMCGSGVTACHNLLAMEHAGLAGSRVFAPSWSGWVGDRTRPVAVGD
jgi:thiosulfate/3-mercaptopyruvate sulfurtransferase